jgi:transcription elongation factor
MIQERQAIDILKVRKEIQVLASVPVKTTAVTATQFANGEVAYLLGDAFGWTISTDAYPVFRTEGNRVYQIQKYDICDRSVTEDGTTVYVKTDGRYIRIIRKVRKKRKKGSRDLYESRLL